MYKEGEVIYDSDLKVDREVPLSITASRVQHLVHLLHTGKFSQVYNSGPCSKPFNYTTAK